MHRSDFGQLVSALRQDLGWTQFKLSEVASVDEAVISQVERGVKRHFEPELLFSLGNAFQLTTLERREFFLAASGLDQNQLVRQPSAATATDVFNARKVLDKMVEMTGQVRLPAFLCDVYSDVICGNLIVMSFFNPSQTFMEGIEQIPGGYNTVRYNFGKDLQARNLVGEDWENYALNSMRAFRENSLRYRAKQYFKYLMKTFRNPVEFPFFDRYWKMVSQTERDKDANTDTFSFNHAQLGPIRYTTSTTISITSFGELFLIHYLPLDEQTSLTFERLAQTAGQGVINFAPWPVKSFPKNF